ncbi:chalcone isomerase family protein [Candidatus Thioglobus sp.]|nr:chalcone isomerase family protein [Candidatus Thioglobus sp.]
MLINFKKILPCLILALGLFSITPALAIDLENNIQYQETKLKLNGHGTRIRFFMKVYEGSLYLESANSNAEEIINNDVPMSIRMDVISSLVTPDAMKTALNEGLEKSTGKNTGPILKEINQLNSILKNEIVAGDFYEFTYLPDSGIHVLKNSTYIDTIPGIDFKKAFFGIFLSSNPIQKSLKKAMLGG